VALSTLLPATPIFASTADVVRARELLVEAATAASGIHDGGIRAGVLDEIAAAQARAGDEMAALTTARSAGRSAWRSVAMGFAAGGNIPAALAAVSRCHLAGRGAASGRQLGRRITDRVGPLDQADPADHPCLRRLRGGIAG